MSVHTEGLKPFMDASELASFLGVSLRTVRTMQQRRLIPFVKIGRSVRFRLSQVEKALEKLTIQPRA
jgi:excisionase family DNA binding protein